MPVPPASTRQAPSSASVAAPEPGITVTCASDGRSHVVPHAVLADSLTAESGRCTAVCGHIVLPASLASPPGAGCVLCEEASGSPRRAVRRRSWIGFMRTPRSA